ncbi:transglycosylase domain-containing protein [Risungbinella massiliensis]|uniref:transglycosylase domain-containing protein n=1 Tax=Risungbinella massiliensis TaxID=1329796 RepID=UPI0005CBB57B|nr:transglycosylase domain-containing protein [Risungbinella massiliensis]
MNDRFRGNGSGGNGSQSNGDKATFTPRTRSQRVGPSGNRSSRVSRSGTPTSPWKRFFNKKWFTVVGITILLLILGGCSALYAAISSDQIDIDKIDQIDFSSTVYGADKKEVTKMGALREKITYEELSKYNKDLILAVVKTEDERFYEHNGIDFYGLGRALVKDVMCLCFKEGGSTITMQVAGNILQEDRSQTISRKLADFAGAWALESKKTKEDIIMAYLNYIPYGNNVQGVRLASKIYFGKDPATTKLEPQEIAMLVGIPNGPSIFNPYTGKTERAKKRRDWVLQKMSETAQDLPQIITEAEAKKLMETPLGADKKFLTQYKPDRSKYSAYIDAMKAEAKTYYELSAEDLENGGYKIYTGMDQKAQDAMLETINENNKLLGDKDRLMDAAATMLDAKTGLVKAISSGKQYKTGFLQYGTYPIQPGSTIKPLAVYSPIMEKDPKNFHPNTIYNDKNDKSTYSYNPNNYNKKEAGQVLLREALGRSLNLTPAHILEKNIGIKYSAEKVRELGIKLEKNDENLSPLSLGGFTKGISTKDMVQAYSVYPNMGKVKKAHFIMEIRDKAGNKVEPKVDYKMDKDGFQIDEETEKAKQVFKPQTAWWSIEMMRDVFKKDYGTGKKFDISGLDLAGKTGTTQESAEGWMVGYTSDTVLAVAVFNTRENGKSGDFEIGDEKGKIWREIMVESGIKSKDMQKPSGVQDPPAAFKINDLNLQLKQEGENVVATWNKQDPTRVQFTLERSTSKSGPWESVPTSGNKAVDPFPYQNLANDSGNIIDNLFGNGNGNAKKTYYYKLTAKDTQATTDPNDPTDNGSMSKEVIASIEVKLNSNGDEDNQKNPDCSKEENKDHPQCKDDGNGGGDEKKYSRADCTKLVITAGISGDQRRTCEKDPNKFFEENPQYKEYVYDTNQQSTLPATRRNLIA